MHTQHGICGKISHAKKSTDVSHVIPTEMLGKHFERGGNARFHLPECVFKPDQWTRCFLRGLNVFGNNFTFKNKIVVELGTGSGINLVLVRSLFDPNKIYGSDIHPDVPIVAESNVRHNLHWAHKTGINIVPGGHNLGTWMNKGFRADVIFGCLPQVVVPVKLEKNFTGRTAETSSHYYKVNDYPMAGADWHTWGLGLNVHALVTIRKNLKRDGQIVLNLGGRPGKHRLLNMFMQHGYKPEILHSETIEQHSGTDISTLVRQEQILHRDKKFEFFDARGTQLNAAEAEKLRESGGKIFHKIYVIAGRKTR